MFTTKTKVVLILLVIILLVSFPVYKLYRSNMYNSSSKIAFDAFVEGDYNASTDNFAKLVAEAPNKSEEGRLKLLLAASYVSRNQEGDMAQGIKLFQDVINDYKIPPVWRAQGLNNVARLVESNNISFYKIHFNQSPYNNFLLSLNPKDSENDQVLSLYYKILKLSDDTYPTSWTEYAIANYMTTRLVVNPDSTSTPEQVAKDIYSYIKEGDSRNDSSIFSPEIQVQGNYYRAISLARSAVTLNFEIASSSEIEQGYKKVLNLADSLNQNDPSRIGFKFVMRARFFYANFLSRFKDRNDDLINILKPFASIDTTNSSSVLWFKMVKNNSDSDARKQIAVKLSNLSSDFDIFWKKL